MNGSKITDSPWCEQSQPWQNMFKFKVIVRPVGDVKCCQESPRDYCSASNFLARRFHVLRYKNVEYPAMEAEPRIDRIAPKIASSRTPAAPPPWAYSSAKNKIPITIANKTKLNQKILRKTFQARISSSLGRSRLRNCVQASS